MNNNNLKVSVLGLGYVGLPLALVMAKNGAYINAFDVDKEKVKFLNSGCTFFDEEELLNLWNKYNSELNITNTFIPSDVYLIAVPTPLEKEKVSCDMSYVKNALTLIGTHLKKGDIVILVSTCPVGTTLELSKLIKSFSKLIAGHDYFLAYCPERLYPGDTYNEIVNNEHIIGGFTKDCGLEISKFYKRYISKYTQITSSSIAELSKLAENAYRDVNIAFANELAAIANQKKENVHKVIELSNLHPRVNILQPGIGVGGHCLPIDPWFLIPFQQKSSSSVIRASRQLNDQVPHIIAKRIIKMINTNKSRPIKKNFDIAFLGYTYKANSSDLRESPAKLIIEIIKSHEFKIYQYDPYIDINETRENVLKNLKNSTLKLMLVEHDNLKFFCEKVDLISWRELI